MTTTYEVYVPAPDKSGYDTTMQVEAGSWRQAMTTAIDAEGIQGDIGSIYVDISKLGFRVTAHGLRRTFRIRELTEEEAKPSQRIRAASGRHDAPDVSAKEMPAARPSHSTSRSVKFKDKATGAFRAIGATDLASAKESGGGRILQSKRKPTGAFRAMETGEFRREEIEEPEKEDLGGVSETALEDVFLEIMDLFEKDFEIADAIDFVIDMATQYIPAEHAALLFANDTGDELYVGAARGEKSDAYLEVAVPLRSSVQGFSMQKGVSLVIKDPQNDPRYSDAVAKQVDVVETSLLIAPIQYGERAFGVLQLVNRKERDGFTQYDSNIVTYIASQMGKFVQQQIDQQPLEEEQ